MKKQSYQTNSLTPAPFWRKMAALIYDTFILFAFILFITTLAYLLNQGQSFLAIRYWFLSYLFIGTGTFLTWFWQKGGQTLGMLSWKIKVVDEFDQTLTWKRAWYRFFLSVFSLTLFGLGHLWCLFDKDKKSLHDRLANTKITLVKG